MRAPWAAALLAVAALLPLASAQASSSPSVTDLPTCAISCLVVSVSESPCSLTNQTCICTNVPLQNAVAECVASNCTVKQALFTQNFTATTCNAPVRNRQQPLIITSDTLGVISAIFVMVRLGFKIFIVQNGISPDDWLILTTVIVGAPSTALNVYGTTAHGLGTDIWTVPYDNITKFGRFFYVMEVLYFAEVTLLKLSLLFFYLRIFPSPGVRRLLWATAAFNVVFGVAFIFLAIFQCSPIDFYWTKWDGEHQGKCLDINTIAWVNAAISIALDLWMLAIPLSQLKRLNLHWKKKIGVGLMFCVGTFVTIVSILRLQSLVSFANSSNPTWDNWDTANWSTIEINVGVICACMPSLRLVLVRLFPGLLGSTAQYYGRSGTGPSRSKGQPKSRTMPDTPGGAQHSLSRSGSDGGIVCSKSYAVEYGASREDEARLVHNVQMRDLNFNGAKSGSNTSEVSL